MSGQCEAIDRQQLKWLEDTLYERRHSSVEIDRRVQAGMGAAERFLYNTFEQATRTLSGLIHSDHITQSNQKILLDSAARLMARLRIQVDQNNCRSFDEQVEDIAQLLGVSDQLQDRLDQGHEKPAQFVAGLSVAALCIGSLGVCHLGCDSAGDSSMEGTPDDPVGPPPPPEPDLNAQNATATVGCSELPEGIDSNDNDFRRPQDAMDFISNQFANNPGQDYSLFICINRNTTSEGIPININGHMNIPAGINLLIVGERLDGETATIHGFSGSNDGVVLQLQGGPGQAETHLDIHHLNIQTGIVDPGAIALRVSPGQEARVLLNDVRLSNLLTAIEWRGLGALSVFDSDISDNGGPAIILRPGGGLLNADINNSRLAGNGANPDYSGQTIVTPEAELLSAGVFLLLGSPHVVVTNSTISGNRAFNHAVVYGSDNDNGVPRIEFIGGALINNRNTNVEGAGSVIFMGAGEAVLSESTETLDNEPPIRRQQ